MSGPARGTEGWRTLAWIGIPMIGYLLARLSGVLDVGLAILPAVIVVWVANIAFVVFMHTVVPWRTNAWGQHVLMFSWAMVVVIGLTFARLVFGDYPLRRDVIDIAYCVLAGAMAQRPWLVFREHFLRRRGRQRGQAQDKWDEDDTTQIIKRR